MVIFTTDANFNYNLTIYVLIFSNHNGFWVYYNQEK